MMQMACKEKERGKKKAASASRLASNSRSTTGTAMTWEEVEAGDALRGRESMLNYNQRVNAIARTAVSVPHTVVNQPVDVSQLFSTQGTQRLKNR